MMETTLNDKLQDITSSLSYFMPEFIIVGAVFLVVLVGLFPGLQKEFFSRTISILALLVALMLNYEQWLVMSGTPLLLFEDMLSLDRGAIFWKFIFDIAALLVVLMGFKFKSLPDKSSEFYALILAVVFGAHLLAMANNLLMIYLAIELISISSYVLTTFSFNKSGMEAGMKYLLFGAAASGVMLYGMSWLYALTGSLAFTDPEFSEMLRSADSIPLIIAGVFVLGGFLFKISAAPMHIWAPDVYTSAPTPVVAFFSVVPKLAGFAILLKWMLVIHLFGLGPVDWPVILAVIAMFTITIGNFSALWQKNVKRMLAYSSVAHSGFLLVGVVAFSQMAMHSVMFYGAVYLIMNIGAFMFVNDLEKKYGYQYVNDYRGFVKKSALITIFIVIIMVSLTGLPPTGGFTAKLLIFSSLWERYALTDNSWFLSLLIFGLVNTVISLFYYLKIPFYMIFKEGENRENPPQNIYSIENFLGMVMVVALLVIFFKPDVLMRIINSVSFAF